MSHNDLQPGQKTGWYEDENGVLTREWDEDDEKTFANYCDVLLDYGKFDLTRAYMIKRYFENPDTLLNRMAGRIAKLAGESLNA